MAPGAKGSFICGIVGFFILGFIFGFFAIKNGISALNQIRKDTSYFKGRGFAIAGILLGIIDIIGWLILVDILRKAL